MKRRVFLKNLIAFGTTSFFLSYKTNNVNKKNGIQLLRHATLIITINNVKLLVDPMLSSKDALDPVQNCGNDIRFPMIELPVNSDELNKLLSIVLERDASDLHLVVGEPPVIRVDSQLIRLDNLI